ncbi:MAG TPA: substrate-binding domain-containing protein [Actinoplanes sp.]
MLSHDRYALILEELRRRGSVQVNRMADTLGVTPMTVRRDLTELAERHLVHRVRGGAVLPVQPATTELRAGRAMGLTVGMVVPSLDYYYPAVVRAAQAVAGTAGIRVVLRGSAYGPDASDQRQVEQLLEAGVSGMLLTPTSEPEERDALLDWVAHLDIPVVLIERRPASSRARWARLDSVSTDHQLGAALAVDHLTGLGHRSIGLLIPRLSPTSNALRDGFWAAVRQDGLDRRRVLCVETDDLPASSTTDATLLSRCLDSGVTAMLVHADNQAANVTQAARELGVDVPHGLSVVSYDDEFAGAIDPPLTAVRPPRSALGQIAMELLVARLSRGHKGPPQRIQLVPQLIPRHSTAKPGRRRRGTASRTD